MALLAVMACDRQEAETEPLETVDISPGIELDISQDVQQTVAKPTLVGVLPSNFPSDLPIVLPASLIDFGQNESGSRYVDLLSPDSQTELRRKLEARIRQNGWQISGDARAGGAMLSKGERKIEWRLRDGKPGTVCRYEY